MLKLTRLPNGMPAFYIGPKKSFLKVYLTRYSGFSFDNLPGAIYLDLGYIAIKLKKNYVGHSIS